jgi:hypothetical protein
MENKYLVAVSPDGKYFGLNESYATTSPYSTESAFDAELIPYKDNSEIHYPTYYFENSNRMKDWLRGYKMNLITICKERNKRTIIESDIYGPVWIDREKDLADLICKKVDIIISKNPEYNLEDWEYLFVEKIRLSIGEIVGLFFTKDVEDQIAMIKEDIKKLKLER